MERKDDEWKDMLGAKDEIETLKLLVMHGSVISDKIWDIFLPCFLTDC